ncbi:MAG: ChaN family lipoprotein [Pseudohongiellaceae bacterium]
MKTGCKWAARISAFVAFSSIAYSNIVLAQVENPDWQSALYDDHPLVGTVWDVANKTAISPSEFSSRLLGVKYLLLGEKHDNPDHHLLQLRILSMLGERNKLSAVAMEMMDADVQAKLTVIADQNFSSDDELKAYLSWDSEGWEWEFYGPLIKSALASSVPLFAGNITRETMSSVYGSEETSSLQNVVGEEVMDQLINDIDSSHCGLLPESQFPAMVRVQQARDAAMAASLPVPAPGATSVLIAGNYHVRQDLGVPNYLVAAEDSLLTEDIVSVSFMEVQRDSNGAEEYIESTAGTAAYDYLWFTPAISDEDYCASMR